MQETDLKLISHLWGTWGPRYWIYLPRSRWQTGMFWGVFLNHQPAVITAHKKPFPLSSPGWTQDGLKLHITCLKFTATTWTETSSSFPSRSSLPISSSSLDNWWNRYLNNDPLLPVFRGSHYSHRSDHLKCALLAGRESLLLQEFNIFQ